LASVTLMRNAKADSSHQMLLYVVNRVVGEILVHLGDDPRPHVRMERMAQVGEVSGRRYDDERFHLPITHKALQRRGDPLCKPMLLEIVPVGVLYSAAKVGSGTLERPTRPVTALLVSRRVLILRKLAQS
jgi:hypothetical protein